MNNEEYTSKMKPNIVQQKAYSFSVEIVQVCRMLQKQHEYILSKQLLRSGTSICANINESTFGQTKPDFINKLSIALKEAYETDYWLRLLGDTGYLELPKVSQMRSDLSQILALLISSLKTAKGIPI